MAAALIAVGIAVVSADARAEDAAPVEPGDFARSERVVVRSPALGRDLALRVRRPAFRAGDEVAVVLVALMPAVEADLVAAGLRQREPSRRGVVVVSLDDAGPANTGALARALAGDIVAPRSSAMTRFLADELRPFLSDAFAPGAAVLLAGSHTFGRVVLEAALDGRGRYDGYAVYEPRVSDEEIARLDRRLGGEGTQRDGTLRLARLQREAGDSLALDALVNRMVDQGVAVDLRPAGPGGASAVDVFGEWAADMAMAPPW